QILDKGTTHLSNAEVLNWTRRTRERYKREDEADKATGRPFKARPQGIIRSLNKTERELADRKYPYTRNPSVYAADGDAVGALAQLDAEVTEAVVAPLSQRALERDASAPGKVEWLEERMAEKGLTRTELLMVLNHAPTEVQILKNMIEDCERRFEDEELQRIVEVCVKVLRRDE
ncbi:hypothetical protein K431DRAFT_191746, partial [Polychaeton citri CBS 116435]